jgi:transcriptional regulator with XRE-family HTH domain/mannose-6-phosphate isomerase-like protein (cupin superfamily)
MSIDKPIARLREKAGLTQAELAQLVGVSENTIANWEKGGATKWIDNLNRLCSTLKCNLADLNPQSQLAKQHQSKELPPNVLETVKSYCASLIHRDRKSADQIFAFASRHDPLLRYWLDQAEQILNQLQPRSQSSQVNEETIVSALKIQHLSNQLNAVLPNQLTFEMFCQLLEPFNLPHSFLNQYVGFSPAGSPNSSFLRKLIMQTRYLTVYVIGWMPGQMTRMHHHGSSLDAIWVVEGEMTHWLLSPEECEQERVTFEECPSSERYSKAGHDRIYRAGEMVFVDRRYAHQIENASSQQLVTFNIRFGATADDERWEKPEEEPMIVWQQMQVEEYQVMPA